MYNPPLIRWDDNLSTGHDRIDSDHQRLIGLTNGLNDAMAEGHGRVALNHLFVDLIHYTATHFKTEEALMDEFNYPDAENHKAEHDKLVDEVMRLQNEHVKGNVTVTVETLTFLRDWLVVHIMRTDKKLGHFLAEINGN